MIQAIDFKEIVPPYNREIRSILYDVVGNPSPEKILQIEHLYNHYSHKFIVAHDSNIGEDSVIGLIGLEYLEMKSAIIKHLSVHESMRKQGIGESLLQYIISNYNLIHIEVETDADAVMFYKKCGFTVQPIAGQYGQRFQCQWREKFDEDHP